MTMRRKTYNVYVQHYGEQRQTLATQMPRADADRFAAQQAEIIRGYEKRCGTVENAFVVFADDDTFKTRIWIAE